jgi:mannose-6-phosphate isomerase-like protein (cupin superfamily)
MSTHEFPSFVQTLPEADLPYPGLKGWLMAGERGQVLYCETDTEVVVPEHRQGEQWGFVIRGRIEMTIQDRTRIYSRGDMYHVPSGAAHRAHIFPGFRAVYHLSEPNRYRVKKRH